jgi:hypothetical protein
LRDPGARSFPLPSWRQLRDIFRELQPAKKDGLYAKRFGTSGTWELRDSPSDSVLRRFKHAATEAASKCGELATWEPFLEILGDQEDTFHETLQHTARGPGGKEVTSVIGVIPRVCEAAADYCEKRMPDDETAARLRSTFDRLGNRQVAPVPPPSHSTQRIEQKTIGDQIDALRLECDWTAEHLAELVDISPRSVYRHLSGKDTPSRLNLARYERVFSHHLEKTIVITRTSANVSKRQNKS